MRLAIPFALALLSPGVLLAVDPDPKALAVPAEKLALAKELVRQLDDDDVDVRDKASAELTKMGRLALPVLRDTLKAKPSNEVEIRVEKLLPAARKDDFTARYPVFLADEKRQYDHDLPGWNELKKTANDTAESRLLFADILKSDKHRGNLVAAFGTSGDERKTFETRWTTKWQEWWTNNRTKVNSVLPPWPLEHLASEWLADLLYDRDYHDSNRSMVISGCLGTADGKKAVQDEGKYGATVRKLGRSWLDTRKNPKGLLGESALCSTLKFDEEVRRQCLVRIIEDGSDLYFSGMSAMSMLATTDDPKYLALFHALFTNEGDRTASHRTQTPTYPEIQVRDTALALSIVLVGQKPTDFGFSTQHAMNGQLKYNPDNYHFTNDKAKTADEKREAAFKKWAEWEKANPDALKAAPPKEKK